MKELIEKLKAAALERYVVSPAELPTLETIPGQGEVEIAGRRAINLGTDDALGLASDPRVKEAAASALRRFGTQGHAAQAISRELEGHLATFLGQPSVRVSGDAQTLLGPLAAATSAVLTDARHHAAFDRLLPKSAGFVRGALPDLQAALVQYGSSALLVLAGVHPNEGDLSHLAELSELSRRFGVALLIDETRSIGVLGANGAGAIEHLLGPSSASIQVGSLSGALASRGAFIAGPHEVIENLEGSALAPACAAAAQKALELIQSEPHRRTRLFEVTQQLLFGLKSLGFDTGPTVVPRIPLWMGDAVRAMTFGRALMENGVLSQIVAVPRRARIVLTPQATHSDAQIDQALTVIERTAKKLGLAPERPSVSVETPLLARPGTALLANPCAAHWVLTTTKTLQDPTPPDRVPTTNLTARLFDKVETLTWRATNVRAPDLRKLGALLKFRRR